MILKLQFYTAGNSIPTIDWNGDTGTLQLVQSYTGGIPNLSFDTTTGIISWTKLLGEGHWIFDIVTTNSAGSTTLEMAIDNTLQGTFTGTYVYGGVQYFYEMEFFTDGTVEVRANNATSPVLSSGTWTINNNDEILVNYTDPVGADYSTFGTLTQTNANAIYSGNWFSGHDAVVGNEEGTFSLAKGN